MTPLHRERRSRLMAAMNESGCDAVLVYGNAWQCDYLRYVTDFPAIEGEAMALFDRTSTAISRGTPARSAKTTLSANTCIVTPITILTANFTLAAAPFGPTCVVRLPMVNRMSRTRP